MRRHTLPIALLTLVAMLPAGIARGEEPTWKIGLAKAKITPEKPFWMAGFSARTRPAEGTLQDLWIKVLVLEAADGQVGVVLTSDLLGIPKTIYDNVCRELDQKSGLGRAQLRLTASHTHSGPALRNMLYDAYPMGDDQRPLIEAYSARLEQTIVATVLEAMHHRVPATLWAGEGTARFAVNRRTNDESKLLEMIRQGIPPKGPSDFTVPVLAVRSPQGKLLAVVMGYAAHTSAMNLKEYPYHYSGDYAGYAQVTLEKALPGAQTMFFQGCGSDQSAAPRGTLARCIEMGESLARAVREVLQKPMRPLAPRLATRFQFVKLDFQPPTRQYLEATAKAKDFTARWAKRLLDQLDRGESLASNYPEYPVQVWKLGENQLWIAMGGEVAVDYALAFEKKYGASTWVSGYSNDVMAYIPSRRIWEEGGYQAGAFPVYGLPAVRWSPDIQSRIASAVGQLVDQAK